MREFERFKIVDNETGVTGDAFIMRAGRNVSMKRNCKTIEAFIDYVMSKNKSGKFGWWTFGVNYGVERYEDFQRGLDSFLRTLNGLWAYTVEIGELGGKLHIHMIMERFHDIERVRKNWQAAMCMEFANINCAGIPGTKKLSNGRTYEFQKEDCARYMAKYASKAKVRMEGIRAFRTTKKLREVIKDFYKKEEFTMFLTKEVFYNRK